MSLIKWANHKIKKLGFWDIQFIKIAVAGFILMIAKFWEPLVSLNWYWYALIFVLAILKPYHTIFKK